MAKSDPPRGHLEWDEVNWECKLEWLMPLRCAVNWKVSSEWAKLYPFLHWRISTGESPLENLQPFESWLRGQNYRKSYTQYSVTPEKESALSTTCSYLLAPFVMYCDKKITQTIEGTLARNGERNLWSVTFRSPTCSRGLCIETFAVEEHWKHSCNCREADRRIVILLLPFAFVICRVHVAPHHITAFSRWIFGRWMFAITRLPPCQHYRRVAHSTSFQT